MSFFIFTDRSIPLQTLSWQWQSYTQTNSANSAMTQQTLEPTPENLSKPMLTEAMSMPLLQHPITLGDHIISK